MNNRFLRFGKKAPMDRKKKNILLSIVILFELILLCTVMSYAWVETISSIKLNNYDSVNNQLVPNTLVDTYVHTRVHLTEAQKTVDLGKYFRQAGDMHLSPASSTNGETFYFPQTASSVAVSGTQPYRAGTIDDKNTTYMSVTFKLTTEAYSSIYFSANPTFSALSSDIRVSVKAVSDDPATYGSRHDTTEEYAYNNTVVFYKNNNATSTTPNVATVVGGADGVADDTQTAHTFYEFTSVGGKKLFTVNGNETMIVTINLWLQKKSTDMDSVMSVSNLTISNLGLTSGQESTTISLIPTGSNAWSNKYYYVWSFDNDHDNVEAVLQQFTLNQETGHYTVQLNSGLPGLLFFSSSDDGLTKAQMNNAKWNSVYKTDDLNFADIPKTLNPTFVITSDGTAGGGTKAGGSWIDPVEINVAYINNQSASTCGLIKVTTYTDTTPARKMEESNTTSDSPHFRKAHGWHDKKLSLTATPNPGWALEGWYTDSSCTAASKLSSTTPTITTAAGGSVTYYAKFKELRQVRLFKYLDGDNVSTTNNKIKINTETASADSSMTLEVDKDSMVTLSATAASGYTITGIYTNALGGDGNKITPETISGSTKSVQITANGGSYSTPMDYYALFTSNYYNVEAHACYSTNNGSTYTENDPNGITVTGGTVKVTSTGTAGAYDSASIKYNTSVSVYASAASGYEFDGWYSAANGGTLKSDSTTYTFTVGAADVDVYARFTYREYNVIAKAYSTTDGTTYTNNDTGGTVKAGTDDAGSSSSALVMRRNNVTLTATAKPGYLFEGWYTAATGGTSVNTNASFSYTLSASATADVTVYARFKKLDDIYLRGSFAGDGWDNGYQMTGNSSGVYTYTYNNLSEGGSFVFKIFNGTTQKWYGYGSTVQEFETCTNRQLNEGNSYKNLKLHGHAGDYTFSYNSTNNKLTVTVSYDYITITLWDDTTAGNGHWIGNDSAQVYFGSDEGWYGPMTKNGNQYTISVPSNCSTNAKFERRVNGDTKNTFSDGNRGYKQGFSARDNGSSSYWY